MKKLVILLLVILLLSGCQPNNPQVDAPPAAPSSEASSAPSTEPSYAASTAQGPKVADWTLEVNDTIEVKIEGISILYTLTLKAVKAGGTTDIGSYTGTASLKQKMDASGLSSEMVSVMGGVDTNLRADNVQIEITAYDSEKYDDFALVDGEAPLTLMSAPNGMALGAITMSGSGNFDVSAIAPYTHTQQQFDESGTGSLEYKLTVEGGQVTVQIPMLNVPGSFNGTITGVPRN